MKKVFGIDGIATKILSKIADLVVINILWVICSLPIVTIGASTTAMFYVTLKMAKNEEAYIVSSFFRAFKESFKQSTVVWIIMILVSFVLYTDLRFSTMEGVAGSDLFFALFLVLTVVAMLTSLYVFPVMAYFENSTKKVIKNSFLLAVSYVPYTLLILIISAIPWVFLVFGNIFVAGFLCCIILFSLAAWVNAHLYRKIFDKHR